MALIGRAASWLLARTQNWRREDGQGMAEYALILVCVAIACVAAFTLFGHAVNNSVNSVLVGF